MNTYPNSLAAKIFGVRPYSVSRWAKRYREHLSIKNLPAGENFIYTDQDMRKLTLIQKMTMAGKSQDEIHLMLLNGQDEDIPDDVTALVMMNMDNHPKYLQKRIEILMAEKQELEVKYTESIGDNKRLLNLLKEKDAEIISLNKKLWQHGIE